MEIGRREFLKLLGMAGAGALAGGISGRVIFSIPDETFQRVMTGPRIETWKSSICTLCPGGCGIRTRLIDGIPVRIQGNPIYPINRGAICPMAEAGVEMLFHPDRIQQPLKRAGARGEGDWQEISWEEAFDLLTTRLRDLRTGGVPERLVLMTQDYNDLAPDLLRRFMAVFGSPNYFCKSETQANTLPVLLTQGLNKVPAFDLANTSFVLNFGGDFLDEPPTPIRFNQLYAALRSRANGEKARLIHVSSYLSRTAANSSEWIAIKPGTMGALALSIAHILIRDETYHQEFLQESTFGFLDWQDATGDQHKGFRNLVIEEYYPEKVARITGIPAEDIIRIAREFAAAETALALAGQQAAASTNGLYTLWAIYCLNALKGNFEKPGGVLFPRDMISTSLPELTYDETARHGLARSKIGEMAGRPLSMQVDSWDQVLPAILHDDPYPVDTLILCDANPVFESTRGQQFQKGLQEIPFVVSCTPFLDDTAGYADLILPDHIFLEKWEASHSVPTVEYLHFGVQQPVIKPLYDTRHPGDIFLQLGKTLGGNIADALPWEKYEHYVKHHAQAIFDSGEGTIVSESVDLSWLEFLKERGWQVHDYSSFEEFWEVLLEEGGWWDPLYPEPESERIFNTESGKFEFYSQFLKKELGDRGLPDTDTQHALHSTPASNFSEPDDLIFLPHFEAPRFKGESSRRPYYLLTYQLLSNINGKGVPSALLQELVGVISREYWNTWVEIHPVTAARHGIQDNEIITLASQQGQISVKAKIQPSVMPEVLLMPFGLGHRHYGQPPRIGLNPYEIFTAEADAIAGIPSLISTRVGIVKTDNRNIT